MPELEFRGKSVVYAHHLGVAMRPLVPCAKRSELGAGGALALDGNLIVHGDNLHALKSLLPCYRGRVNCVYIDPPYNTGNEGWCYNDKVNSPLMRKWLKENGAVDKEDLVRHDKWLCMMWPRLQLLKELLADDGAIFISIDDNEVHHLRMIMNEIFGEKNFKANFIWQHRKSSQNDIDISLSHNYIFCYSKNSENFCFNRLLGKEDIFSNPDNDKRGDWVADPMDAPGIRENLTYEIINPNTKKEYLPPDGRCWRFTKKKYEDALIDNRIVFGKTGNSKPQYKRFKFEAMERGKSIFTLWDDAETAVNGTQQVMGIFDGKKIFDTPKPVGLLKKIISIASDENSIILDSFAGSGTTAHAVLDLNKEDGGSRQFILVECEDYADSITAERVRRVIKGIPNAKKDSLREGLGGTFTYCTLGEIMTVENMLKEKKFPSYESLASHVFSVATAGKCLPSIPTEKARGKDGLLGALDDCLYYLIYQPNLKFMESNESALNITRALRIVEDIKTKKKKKAVVFATQVFLDQKDLRKYHITFSQLPYCIE